MKSSSEETGHETLLKKFTERERDKHMLTLALSGGSQVTLINPIYFFWVEVSRAWADDSNDVKYLLTLILTGGHKWP